jgi:chorismate synthase
MENGLTLGSPLCFIVKNQNIKKEDYDSFSNVPRPGHADYTYLKKYGLKASSGGGRSSARETIARVIAGSVAKQYLKGLNIGFASWVHSVGEHSIPEDINQTLSKDEITSVRDKISNEKVDDLCRIH